MEKLVPYSEPSSRGENIWFYLNGEKRYLRAREFEFLILIREGYTGCKDILSHYEHEYGIEMSPSTVKNHLNGMFKRLGIPKTGYDRGQIKALLAGIRLGLIQSYGPSIDPVNTPIGQLGDPKLIEPGDPY